jgi:hypothetical protein
MDPQVPDNRKLQGTMVGHFVCVDGSGEDDSHALRFVFSNFVI